MGGRAGAPPLPELEFIHEGGTNLYVYPEAADYARVLPPHWHRLDSCVRETDEAFAVPPSSPSAAGHWSTSRSDRWGRRTWS